jgi:hypothetical protein
MSCHAISYARLYIGLLIGAAVYILSLQSTQSFCLVTMEIINFYFRNSKRQYMFRLVHNNTNLPFNTFMEKPICFGHIYRQKSAVLSRPADSRLTSKPSTNATLYTWPPDDGVKMSPKHIE